MSISVHTPLPHAIVPSHECEGAPYAEAIKRYSERDLMRLNVPGHAAGTDAHLPLARFFGHDLLAKDFTPLLAGIDKGHNSPLIRARNLAAAAWGARTTWFLTNGASQGNRMIALALATFRDAQQPVVTQRSIHSSFIDGIVLAGLMPAFMEPSIDHTYGIAHGISPAVLREQLDRADNPKAAYVISPSYFGATADIAGLAEVAHAAGVPLIVDAAWGAHYGFHPDLPQNPLALGADLMVSSTHKLGGSLTQSAMLHLGEGEFARELEPLIERAFNLTQSTSNSSLLLASLDLARYTLETGSELLEASIRTADEMRAALRRSPHFSIVSDTFDRVDDIVAVDPLRVSIDISATGRDGRTVLEILARDHDIYTEISTDRCIVAIVGLGSTPDVGRLVSTLESLVLSDAERALAGESTVENMPPLPPAGPLVALPRTASLGRAAVVSARDAVGRVSTDSLAAYPPGIPNLLPGERITREVIDFLQHVARLPGGYVRGALDPFVETVRVVEE
ncbi:PLP-dependent transferase [Lysinibacter sp. HNR]|uniref:aminotransferase class I/II-fold pyridoxal phosphate-dependent enzyme n=1 Tax=Lysinibacter sp. HNR TaxID=3031408 RepID=UPI0024358268|nr:PLP-dependent transferase [Lysinibacter sp. HNR]WGD37397.1 PLP-dependent transferase [Lysinibacter sp. HNR]